MLCRVSILEAWILLFVNILAVVQRPLALGLHHSELITNVIRDERQWRCATGRKGLRTVTNPVKTIFTHLICLVLSVAKPFMCESFRLVFVISVVVWALFTIFGYAYDGTLNVSSVFIFTALVRTYCLCKTATKSSHPRADLELKHSAACFFTFVALYRPHGPWPVAYGHVQTLTNLVDEWSPVMWWGHKEDGIPYCHAGTSDHPDVMMDCFYAGSGVESLAPVS
ncbi:hypothetical protein BDR03DRAFT_1009743 [Suillus americanus]|nr:hypothetical protein BDR03DRAFT_1009743 [Suillus americanus]